MSEIHLRQSGFMYSACLDLCIDHLLKTNNTKIKRNKKFAIN